MATTTTTSTVPPTQKVISPVHLSDLVLRSTQVPAMTEFYKTFLGGHTTFESPFMNTVTYDTEHHRVAIMAAPPGTTPTRNPSIGYGLEHFAFTFADLRSLLTAYQQRKAVGIKPFMCLNHGPTTSIYYRDPDGNQIETQIDNMDVEGATAFLQTKAFRENPIGTDFDPEELLGRLEGGEAEEALLRRVEVGPRGPESIKYLDDSLMNSTIQHVKCVSSRNKTKTS